MSIKSKAPKGATHFYENNSYRLIYCFYCDNTETWFSFKESIDCWIENKELDYTKLEVVL